MHGGPYNYFRNKGKGGGDPNISKYMNWGTKKGPGV